VLRFIAAVLLNIIFSAQASTISVDAPDVGEHYQFTHVEAQIQISNHSKQSLPIRAIKAYRPEDRVLRAPTEVAAGATVTASVELFLKNDLGNRWHAFGVAVGDDDPLSNLVRIHVFGVSLLDEPRPQLDFSVVNVGEAIVPKIVPIASQEIPALKATKVLSAPEGFIATVSEDGASVSVSVSKTAPWGMQDSYVKVALDSPQQPEMWIEVRADVHGAVIPSANPFALGVMRGGANNEFLIRLDNRSGKDFKIDNLLLEGIKGQVHEEPCTPHQAGCRMIRLNVADAAQAGKLNGKIMVGLPEFKHTLPIVVSGMFLKADTNVVSLDDQLKKTTTESDAAPAAISPTKLSDALNKAVHPPVELANPIGTGPLLKWNVANEQNIYGYVIYRADAEAGPFHRVNKDLVRVMAEENAGATYKWRDSTATTGKTYWYYVGLIYGDGLRHQLSSPQKITAK
jgi:hypothetical protein